MHTLPLGRQHSTTMLQHYMPIQTGWGCLPHDKIRRCISLSRDSILSRMHLGATSPLLGHFQRRHEWDPRKDCWVPCINYGNLPLNLDLTAAPGSWIPLSQVFKLRSASVEWGTLTSAQWVVALLSGPCIAANHSFGWPNSLHLKSTHQFGSHMAKRQTSNFVAYLHKQS